jgi:hypothetical protein
VVADVVGVGLGWAKIVRTAAATISDCSFGTKASTLRRKWTRRLPDAGIRAGLLHQVVDLTGRGAVQIHTSMTTAHTPGDTAAAFEQRREEDPVRSLRNLSLNPGRRRQGPGPVSVALGGSGVGAFVAAAPITAVTSASINAC